MQLNNSPIKMLEQTGNLKQAQIKYAMAKGLDKPYDFMLVEPLALEFNDWYYSYLEAAKVYAGILKLTGALELEEYQDCRMLQYSDGMDSIIPYFNQGMIGQLNSYTFCALPYHDDSLVLTQNPLEKKDLIKVDFSCRRSIVGVFGLSDDKDRGLKLDYIDEIANHTPGTIRESVSFDDCYAAYAANTKVLRIDSFK